MPVLVLVRHGQSLWNAQNQFTGWTDIDLSSRGKEEAQKAGRILQQTKIDFYTAWASVLKRAVHTLQIILKEAHQPSILIQKSWRLNERHYGRLQGINKQQAVLEYGEEQVFQWRRGFHTRPPLLSSKQALKQAGLNVFQNIPKNCLPRGESLKDTLDRVLPLWTESIFPILKSDKNVLITAHGNSLRALVKHVQKIDEKSICQFEVPTAAPLKIQWFSVKNLNEKPDVFEFLSKKE